MRIEIVYKGGTRERLEVDPQATLLSVVSAAEARKSDHVKAIKVLKHDRDSQPGRTEQ